MSSQQPSIEYDEPESPHSSRDEVSQRANRFLSHVLVTDFYDLLSALGKVIRAFRAQFPQLREILQEAIRLKDSQSASSDFERVSQNQLWVLL